MDEPCSSSSAADDDEIVREIPIFNSTRLQNSLYLLRYPMLSKKCPMEPKLKRGFFKPNNQEVELEMEMDIESPNFVSHRAETIAEEVDGPPETRKFASKVLFENDMVDKVVLKSSPAVKEPSKYAALTYTGKEIHLTTLRNIFQFHPSFAYLDKTMKKRKDHDHELSDEEEAGPSTAEAVTVKFKQSDDRWKESKRFKTPQEKNPDEAFIRCEVHPEISSLSKVEKLKLIAENVEPTGQAMNLSDGEYLRVLIPEDEGEGTTEPSSPSHVMSLHTLRSFPILERCRVLLKDAQILQFQQLMMVLVSIGGEGLTADTLLKSLPKVAVLVRGNWVVKSEVLYPNNTFSSTSGVPAELMCRTRDYVLYLFTKNHYVERKKVSSVMKIPSEEVKEIFKGFSKLSHNKGWELLLPTDNDFIVKHSDMVQKQKDAWEDRFKQLSEFLKDNQRQRRKSKSVSEDGKVRNGTNYMSSDNDSGTEKNKSPVAARKNKIAKIKDGAQGSVS